MYEWEQFGWERGRRELEGRRSEGLFVGGERERFYGNGYGGLRMGVELMQRCIEE